jgi:hypothetical protein
MALKVSIPSDNEEPKEKPMLGTFWEVEIVEALQLILKVLCGFSEERVLYH